MAKKQKKGRKYYEERLIRISSASDPYGMIVRTNGTKTSTTAASNWGRVMLASTIPLTDEDDVTHSVHGGTVAFTDRNYDEGSFVTFNDGSECLFSEETEDCREDQAKIPHRHRSNKGKAAYQWPLSIEISIKTCIAEILSNFLSRPFR